IRLLRGDFADGDTIVVDVQNGELDFTRAENRVRVMPEAEDPGQPRLARQPSNGGTEHAPQGQERTGQRIVESGVEPLSGAQAPCSLRLHPAVGEEPVSS